MKPREKALPRLTPTPYGWAATLPDTFLGVPIALDFSTRDVPESGEPPRPSRRERALARLLLANLPLLLKNLESQFRAHASQYEPNVLEHVTRPQIWISREVLHEEGRNSWAFVVHQDDAPDFGFHFDFQGLAFHTMWSGD